MRKAVLGSIAAMTAGAGFAAGQTPRGTPPAPIAIAPSVSGLVSANGMEMPDGSMPGGMLDPMMQGAAPSTGAPGTPGAPGTAYPGGPGMGYPGGPGMGYPGAGYPGGPGMGYPGGPEGYGDPTMGTHASRWWFNAAYTVSRVRPMTGGTFLTTSAPADGGLIGSNTTSVLVGGDIGFDEISGFRIFAGMWRDCDQRCGFEFGGFLSGQKTVSTLAGSDGTGQPLIARPFIDATTGAPGSMFVSFPTYASGIAEVSASTLAFGAEFNALSNFYRSAPGDKHQWTFNALIGLRYVQVEESLTFTQLSNILPLNSAPFGGQNFIGPVTIAVQDSFYTANRFYGAQFGFSTDWDWCRYTMNLGFKLAMGVVHQTSNVAGNSALVNPAAGTTGVVRGGLYANASNIGSFSNDEFAVVPEWSTSFGYRWCSWLTTYIGYNGLYINKVVRPGDQLTQTVNPSQVPTSPNYGIGGAVAVPNPAGTQTYYWLQGVSFGLNARF